MNLRFTQFLLFLVSLFSTSIHAQSSCQNEDFESSPAATLTASAQITGWIASSTVQSGPSNNCNMLACCGYTPVNHILISTAAGYTDNTIGSVYPIYSVFGSSPANSNAAVMNPQLNFAMKGDNFLKLGTAVTGPAKVDRISKTVTVSPSNNLMEVAFISVYAKGHDCCSGAMFKATINNYTCPLIFTSAAPAGLCNDANKGITFYATTSGTLAGASTQMVFNKWRIRNIDLSAFSGQTVTINFTTAHCASSGHFGYSYIDARCSALQLTVNGNGVPLLPGTTSISTCGGAATITAPGNFESYQWAGPQSFTANTSSITVSTPGTYSLTLSDSLSCNPVSHTILVMPQPTAMISSNQATSCAGSAVILTATGLTSYTWQTGKNTASISVTPTITTTYTLSGADAFSCAASQSFTQFVKPCTGIYDYGVDADKIKIAPNPARDNITVTAPYLNDGRFLIYNTLGRVVYSGPLSEGENRISVSGLAPGIYYYCTFNNIYELKKGKLIVD